MSKSRFQRYVDSLSDEEALLLHRIVCQRAAYIYEPRYRSIRLANQKIGLQHMTPEARKRRDDFNQFQKDAAARRRAQRGAA